MKSCSLFPWRAGLAGLALTLATAAGLALAAGAPSARAQAGKAGDRPVTQRLVLAYYHYNYQGDNRKQLPKTGIRTEKGLSLLTNHPWESVGPWMSYDRAQWHKNQFQMMSAGGIDVALAVYKGDKESRRGWALKGLDVMTQGLKELRSEGLAPLMKVREYPQIGLALDLAGLQTQYGAPVDLKDADVQKSLYGMVRDFYLHIPEEFRATVQLPAERLAANTAPALGTASTNQGAAYIVRLINDSAVKDADASFLTYVNRRFAQEFGARLVWVGTPALREKVRGFDAVAPYPAAVQSAAVNTDGWVRTGSTGPGYDNSSQGPGGTIRPRDNGQQSIVDFKRLVDDSPEWVFIDSWNNYPAGSDVAPTLEYGLLYRDLIRAAVLQYKQSADYAADFLKASVPRVMLPGQVYQVEVVVQNSGTYDWDVFNVASLSYRWLKDGQYVGGPTAAVQSNGQIRGDKKSFLIGVAPPVKDGQPLPNGTYELEFNMNRRVGNEIVWFDQADSAPFRVPVTVGPAPASRPHWSNSTMHNLAARGAVYPAQIRLRNDGSDTWKRGQVSVGYRWRKVSTYLKGLQGDADEVIAEGKRVPLEADVAPGRLVTVEVPVSITNAQGQPLQTWSPAEDWVYVLEWDVHDGSKYLSTAGGATYREPVEVVDRDPAPSFVGCNLPNELIAGKIEKITVGLQNNGPDTYKKGRDKVVVHWYYMDGTEASFNDEVLPLQEDVPPFSRVLVDVPDDLAERLFGVDAKDPKNDRDRKDERERKDEKDDKDRKGDKARKEREEREKREREEREKKEREKQEREEREKREREARAEKKDGKKSGKSHKEWVVQPTVLRDVPVRVPYYFGPMYCVFDFQQDGLNASTGASTKGNDILVIPVNVYSPTFTPLPAVQGFFNVDGISQDVDRGDGNLDGRGNSLPAEFMPPYVPRPSVGVGPQPSPLYPSGLWVRPLNALDSSRTCFWYPSKNNQLPNMIECRGQKIDFAGQGRTAVHVLALSTEENAKGDFLLYYSDGTVERKPYTFTHWNDAPKHGELVALSTPHRHTRAGDDPSTRCYINHYIIPTDRLKFLVGLELPRQPAVKVMAVTLESATLKNNSAGM